MILTRSAPVKQQEVATIVEPGRQCLGKTKVGKRCLNKASKDNKYCHYHVGQDSDLVRMMAFLSVSTKPVTHGYIYMYTLDVSHTNVHILDKKSNKWVPLGDTAKASSRFNIFSRSKKGITTKPSMMLLKIGMTSKDPEERLLQWKQKCRHSIMFVEPPKESVKALGYCQLKRGWPTGNAKQAESSIHEELRGLFGNGHVECEGCMVEGSKARKRHIEWFLVPTNQLAVVFETIHYWTALFQRK